MRVAFHVEPLSLRGTATTIWMYAWINQHLLGNQSVILGVPAPIPRDDDPGLAWQDNIQEAEDHFTKHFETYVIPTHDLDRSLKALNIDMCLMEVGGYPGYFPPSVPTIAHCVFHLDAPLKATLKTAISEYLISQSLQKNAMLLPNVLYLSKTRANLREALGIPKDARVFARYGGYKQFSIPFVREAVREVARAQPNTYFLFMNTCPSPLLEEPMPNVRFLHGTADLAMKRKFINTADAMLHARIDGETFGCACGEFAICGKPVLTADIHTGDTAHFQYLRQQAIPYRTKEELVRILSADALPTFQVNSTYTRYLPEGVAPYLKDALDACQRAWDRLREPGRVQPEA